MTTTFAAQALPKHQQETMQRAEAAGVNLQRLPKHIAVIMDGNGRWAKMANKPRIEGHRAGIKSVREIVRVCRRLEIRQLTLYAFSSENWKRPQAEVNALMILLCNFLNREIREMKDNGIRLETIGHTHELPRAVIKALEKAKSATADGETMQLSLALSYGGRQEIVDAARRISQASQSGQITPDDINDELFERYLDTAGYPELDLLIRTSGEVRVSNFLLWQIAYSEIWITDVLWPDFRQEHLFRALCSFQNRQRRFGGVDIDGAI